MQIFGRSFAPAHIVGVGCILSGLVCNKFVIEALFSRDGDISTLSVNIALLLFQGFLIGTGILYLKQAYGLLSRLGIGFLLLVTLQFWIRIGLEVPFPEHRMLATLPKPPTLFEAGWDYRDQVSRYEARFEAITAYLPSTGSIGYVTSEHFSPEEAKFHYGLTTYALVPLYVARSTRYEFLIGNFPDQETPVPDIEGFRLIQDAGNGIAWFQRTASP
ncbi:hypothetical protein GF339_03705 [candidate division KSB3 bacterium]|uniref:Uncharacterized protein n=1 Tax=candidate division KSB3 bacterium TaxID=2044937 RepID=A0A9D5JT01_9BACT|nr:hypothetical protein [candidate division KSB3 bacterium]MBD3323663.1 hypothetical protein [candidate division KSB3 bacterium]